MNQTDNDLIRLFLPLLQSGLIDYGYTDVEVVASAQPTQEGITSGAGIFFQKSSARRYGFPRATYRWDNLNNVELYELKYFLETSFQFRALSRANPTDSTAPTASDLLDASATILQSDPVIYALSSQGVGLSVISDEPVTYFTDDQDKFEQAPYFTLTLSHSYIISRQSTAINTVSPGIYRV